MVFQCNNKYKKGHHCKTPHFSENELKEMSLRAMNKLLSEREEVITNIEECLAEFCDDSNLRERQEEIGREMTIMVELIQNMVAENARRAQNQDEYLRQYNAMVEKYEKAKEQYDLLGAQIQDIRSNKEVYRGFVDRLRHLPGVLEEFDENLFGLFTEEIVVNTRNDISFIFKDGSEIKL